MLSKLVVDSSVSVAAVKTNEEHHKQSRDFFRAAEQRGHRLYMPAITLWEIGAALDHPIKTPAGTRFDKEFDLTFDVVPVDETLFQKGWISDLREHAKGPDRIFLSCAIMLNAPLVTWDRALKDCASRFGVTAMTPAEIVSRK